MDNLGSEVGQKMRSAVKAKLLELGTGGSAGYIDDELPDYVMIMVANKRSKQQMISDLNLFLGSQTDLFVTWLHEVLQKLQEVTLPAVALQKKRKTTQKDEATLNKKDKKDKKKDKKTQKKASEQESNATITSITDVFAGDLIEKAKKTFEIDTNAVHKDKKQEKSNDEADDFNIPTVADMAAQPSVVDSTETREKDLAELADIQKKIYAAKKQLKILDDVDESEDEDFLNIKEDAEDEGEEEFEETNELGREKKKQSKAKSPIIFDRNDRNTIERQAPHTTTTTINEIPIVASSVDPPAPKENFHFTDNSSGERAESVHNQKYHKSDLDRGQEQGTRKKSIHERLGHINRDHKSEHPHQHRRAEKELYVPAFRRREMEKEKRSNGEVDSRASRKRSSSADRNNRDRENSAEGPHQQRIGSRVVVAPPKPDLNEEESDNQRPVNSVIKIKPRPSISPSKQACKNLLLRAVAEAQRSTILVKPKKDISIRQSSSTSGGGTKRNAKYFTKSYRDRINRDALIRRTAKNFVIEVKADPDRQDKGDEEMDQEEEEEEYVPEQVSDRGESDVEDAYVPHVINYSNNEQEDFLREENDDSINQNKTQFVVTLNDKTASNYKSKSKSSRLNGSEHSSRPESQKSSRDKPDVRSRLTLKKEQTRIDRESNSSPSCSTPPRPSSSMSSSKKSELIKIYKRPKEVKKIVIKNDSEDDDFHSPKKESQNKLAPRVAKDNKQEQLEKKEKHEKLSLVKEEKASGDTEEDEGSMTPPLPPRKQEEKQIENKTPPNKRKRQLIKFDLVSKQTNSEEPVIPAKRRSNSYDRDRDNVIHNENETNVEDGHKISTKNVESKKYDNLPSSLNSVPIDSSLVMKSKPKERCKYFPTCTKDVCEFYHPAAPCKSFPNCKFADKCIYVHPKCKFDLTCTKIGCNFQHSAPIGGQLAAPPLSSHVVPVQNYKSISSAAATATPSMCKFYPNCSKPGCPFFHPKMCRFGKFCNNKMECNFYHHDAASSKFKWVASIV